MIDDRIKDELGKKLNPQHIKKRKVGYGDKEVSLSYVEAWHAIDEANRIFGFDGWARETVSMIETHRDVVTVKDKWGTKEQWRVSYVAKVRVTALGVVREGTGFGAGQSKPEDLGAAIESATKEAESDAMKRALMTFGNPFGLALYDKAQANVGYNDGDEEAEYLEPKKSGGYKAKKGFNDDGSYNASGIKANFDLIQFERDVMTCTTVPALMDLLSKHKQVINQLEDEHYARVQKALGDRKQSIIEFEQSQMTEAEKNYSAG